MTNHRDDETNDMPLDARLLDAARNYNAPPATPRDAMWERMAAARAAAPRTAEVPAVRVIPLETRSRRSVPGSRRPIWALPLAAALLLGVGIGVGRMSVSRKGAGDDAPARPTVAIAPDLPTPAAPSVESSREPSAQSAEPRAQSPQHSAESREPRAESPSLAYRLATAEHLASTETLLATISADAKAGRADTSVAAWARDLLGTTRVLLDSPAGRDPKMARLLEDLELVLAQVAQMPASGRGAEELQTIERAVRRRDVMTRVRAAIPTGPLSAGT